MKVAIHQPDYLPWLPYFHKIKAVDLFVLMDCVEYGGKSSCFHNRNKIKVPNGWAYLTIPLGSGIEQTRIKDVKLPKDQRWQKKHLKSISLAYQKAPYFKEHKEFFENLYNSEQKYLADFNIEIINYLSKAFGFKTKLVRESELEVPSEFTGSERIMDILKKTEASYYLSGPYGKTHLDSKEFEKLDIDLDFMDYEHPEYKQLFGEFIPGLSAIDLLFNEGEKSGDII